MRRAPQNVSLIFTWEVITQPTMEGGKGELSTKNVGLIFTWEVITQPTMEGGRGELFDVVASLIVSALFL